MDLAKLFFNLRLIKPKLLELNFLFCWLDHAAGVFHAPAGNHTGVALALFAVAGVPASVEQMYLLKKIPHCLHIHNTFSSAVPHGADENQLGPEHHEGKDHVGPEHNKKVKMKILWPKQNFSVII